MHARGRAAVRRSGQVAARLIPRVSRRPRNSVSRTAQGAAAAAVGGRPGDRGLGRLRGGVCRPRTSRSAVRRARTRRIRRQPRPMEETPHDVRSGRRREHRLTLGTSILGRRPRAEGRPRWETDSSPGSSGASRPTARISRRGQPAPYDLRAGPPGGRYRPVPLSGAFGKTSSTSRSSEPSSSSDAGRLTSSS